MRINIKRSVIEDSSNLLNLKRDFVLANHSFIKTLKREEIYARRYDNLEHLRANIEEFIEAYYNRQRLHSALGYRSPEEFEKQSESSNTGPEFRSAAMNYFENNGNEARVSELVIGEEDSIAVPFPEPHPLLEDPGKAQ